MCQPYHHQGTGILKKGPELKELFSQVVAPLNHLLPFSFAHCAFAQAKHFGIRSYFSLA